MLKFTTLAILAGLAPFAVILPSAAQVAGNNNNNQPPPTSSSDSECAYQLNYMPRVTRALIDSIAGQRVYLVPVCEDGVRSRDDYGWLFVSGNVGTLRLPISRNATLMKALTAEGYDHQDVISLRVGGDNSIVLYVHQRHLR